jgi:hypothetical protein
MSKKGSIAVLLTLLFMSLLLVVSFFVNAAGFYAGRSMSESSFDLAGRSVLADYDKRLKETYGIFAFYGQEPLISSKLYKYASFSIESSAEDKDKSYADLLRLHLKSIDADASTYSLLDLNIFENQLTEQMKYKVAEGIANSSNGVITQIDQGLALVKLVKKVAAIYEDLMKLNDILKQIEEASKTASVLESKLSSLIQSEIDNESQDLKGLQSIKVISRELRINVEAILFNINLIDASIQESQRLLEDLENEIQGIDLNQAQWNENDMLNKLDQIKTLIVKIVNQQSQTIQTKMKTNSEILQKLEEIKPTDKETISRFQSQYEWDILYDIFLNLSLTDVIKEQINNDFKEKPEKLLNLTINEIMPNTGRILKNSSILKELPSYEDHGKSFDGLAELMSMNELPNFKALINQGLNTLMVNEYIGLYMNNHLGEDNKEHFFQNEMEYILFGSPNDEKNYQSVKNSILALRSLPGQRKAAPDHGNGCCPKSRSSITFSRISYRICLGQFRSCE